MYPIEKMCKVLGVSRSGYYQWSHGSCSNRARQNEFLLREITNIYEQSHCTYGSPRIHKELVLKGYKVSRPRVARIMRYKNIQSKIRKKWIVTTDSNHTAPIAPNLVNRNFTVDGPGQIWVSDLTYIRTNQGWLYLTVILDLFDRKVIGWATSNTMMAQQTSMAALRMALANRVATEDLIFHSDRGIQYACTEFTTLLRRKNIRQSMSRKGDCWDNEVAESFFKTLKVECIYQNKLKTKPETQREVFTYIEIWYNRKRRHSALGYATPLEMELKFKNKLAA